MRSIRRKMLIGLVPVTLVLGALGVADLGHGDKSADGDSTQAKIAKVLATKSDIQHGVFDTDAGDPDNPGTPTFAIPTSGDRASEPTITSLYAQQEAERSFQGETATAAMIQNGVNQYNYLSNSTLPGKWTSLGPNSNPNSNNPDPVTGKQLSVSGRVSAFAVVPSTCTATTCSTMYVGPANGGLWKTTDGGATWAALTDNQLNTAIGAIAIDPKNSNIVYVGTGEPNVAGDTQHGIGLLRSTDGGATWTQLDRNDFVNRSISTVIVDPKTAGTTSATIYVTSHRAVNGSDYSQSAGCSRCTPGLPAIGFYKSTNGGTTFTKNNPAGVSDNAGSQSLVMDPTNPSTLYLGISGDAANAGKGWYDGAGLYKSTDAGATWTQLSNDTSGLPSGLQRTYSNLTTYSTVPRLDRVTVAMGTDNPNVVYVAYGARSHIGLNSAGTHRVSVPAHEDIYKSTNAGATFTQLTNTPNACATQCIYDMPLAVDPTNSNVVYAGGMANYDWSFGGNTACYAPFTGTFPTGCNTALMKTTDGGATWHDVAENSTTGSGLLHPDDHVIVIAPGHTNVVFTGSDGGLYRSSDGADSWTGLNDGLDTLQAESVAVGPTGNIFFGTQDNGTYRLTPGSTTSLHVGFGDGGVANVDQVDPNVAYYTQYGGNMERDDTANAPSATHSNPFSNGSGTFIGPAWAAYSYFNHGLFYEPNATSKVSHKLLFSGTDTLYRSTDQGGIDNNNNWNAADPGDVADWAPITPELPAGSWISAIATSPTDANTIAYATSSGKVFVTHNALAPVVTKANTAANDPLDKLFGVPVDRSCDITQDWAESLDGCNYVSGITWTEVSSGLPGRWITSLKWGQPNTNTAGSLYATASSFGALTPSNTGHVYELSPNDASFVNISGGNSKAGMLPDMPTNDIVVSPKTGHLYVAADYGVFISTNDGTTWKRWDNGLPNVPIYMMTWDPTTNKLVVSTHGRGIWTVQAP